MAVARGSNIQMRRRQRRLGRPAATLPLAETRTRILPLLAIKAVMLPVPVRRLPGPGAPGRGWRSWPLGPGRISCSLPVVRPTPAMYYVQLRGGRLPRSRSDAVKPLSLSAVVALSRACRWLSIIVQTIERLISVGRRNCRVNGRPDPGDSTQGRRSDPARRRRPPSHCLVGVLGFGDQRGEPRARRRGQPQRLCRRGRRRQQ